MNHTHTVMQNVNGWQRPTFTGTLEECQNYVAWLKANCDDFDGAYVAQGVGYLDPIHP